MGMWMLSPSINVRARFHNTMPARKRLDSLNNWFPIANDTTSPVNASQRREMMNQSVLKGESDDRVLIA
jgi:hypothetical protein